MKLNRSNYLKKVKGCFIGKNIGGTFGGPYEGTREVLDVKGFITEKGEPLPNDDLDLQLVWLTCLENEGPKHTNSETLGQYWMSYIVPYWNEYGIAKTNMLKGLQPSIAGDYYNNIWKHSNGAWIRTEIWACLNPGAIDTAVKYSLEDAMVDHGEGEGTAAAAFVAALESAAFFETDVQKLIDIGLAKINKESRLHSTIAHVRKRFKENADYITVRNEIVELNKDIGDGWFQAPNNIAFVVIGLLWGAGDFKKSMIYAVNCGDDTDCTAATIGSILGIIYNEDGIPEDWKEYVGDTIKTISINGGVAFQGFKTIDDLVERINKQVDYCLYSNKAGIELTDKETEIDQEVINKFTNEFALNDERDDIRVLKASLKADTFKITTGCVTTIVTYLNGASVKLGDTKKIEVMAVNNYKARGNMGHQVLLELIMPKGYECNNSFKEAYAPCWTPMSIPGETEKFEFSIKVNEILENFSTVILKVSVVDQGTISLVPIRFVND